MNDLPKGWRCARLDALIAEPLANGRSVPTAESGFPVLRLTAISDRRIDVRERKIGNWSEADARRHLVRPGDFLVARGNGSLSLVGRGGLVGSDVDPVAFPDTMIRIRPRPEVLDAQYLALAWESSRIRSQIEAAAKTTAGIFKINQGDLSSIEIPLPGMDEQRRIVDLLGEHLSRLDAGLQSVERVSRLVGGWRVSAVQDSLTERAPNTSGTLAPPAAGVNDAVVGALPGGWRWMRLAELADVVGGITKDSGRQSDPTFVEVPYLRVANVQRGHLDLETVTTIRVPPSKAQALRLQPGDVLMNEGGDRDKLGRGWVWEGQIQDCIHQNHVFRARIRDQLLDPYLLSWATNTIGARWCEANGRQSVNLASISLRTIRLMPVPVPPKTEQAAIRERIETTTGMADRLEASVAAATRRASALRRALLGEAFAGRLGGVRA